MPEPLKPLPEILADMMREVEEHLRSAAPPQPLGYDTQRDTTPKEEEK